MAKNTVSSLLKEYEKILKTNQRETQKSIDILKAMVQCCVETNDDESAYIYQKKVCTACEDVYGSDALITRNMELYCRELMIRTSPLPERVKLCREYWEDAKREYGENSYLVRILAPLYLMCCSEANEIEELKIVCSEIIEYFGSNEDTESRELVALCSSFDIISGEKSGSIEELNRAVLRMESVFGKDSLMSLRIQNEIGYVYKKNKEFDKAAELCRRLYLVSAKKNGRFSYDTIVFQKDYVMNIALSGKYRIALSEAKSLEKAVKKCPEKNRCPDIYECFMYIYMGLGKEKIAEKYGRKSIEYNQKALGEDDLTTAKARFILAAKALFEVPDNHIAFTTMMDYMTLKEQWLYHLFLLSSDVTREKVFAGQNRGEFDICLSLALDIADRMSREDIYSLWEISCNYKSLIGDCELLHSVIERNPYFLQKKTDLQKKMQSGNSVDIIELQRQILEMTASRDFAGYVNSVHVNEIQKNIKDGEMLLDYYIVHYSELQVYVCVAATSDKVRLFQVGSIEEIDSNIHKIITTVSDDKYPVELRHKSDVHDEVRNTVHSNIQKITEMLQIDGSTFKKLIVCPDGELYRLPFDILFDDCEVVYVTNAKDIVRSGKHDGNNSLIKDVYVFADPLFHQSDEQTNTYSDEPSQERSEYLSRLPGTYAEANIISRIFGNKVKQFTGEKANREMFLDNCNGDILHIGTHATASDGGKIYLSRADDYINSDEYKGYITSHDIAKLNMENTRLAVLSACQTGIGEYRNYLGVRGLRRSFQLAGVETVISTMWNISDMATAVFMYAFYSNYSICSDGIKALSYAKDYMKTATVEKMKKEIYGEISDILLKSGNTETYRAFRDLISLGEDSDIPFSSPYYWAAFTLYKSFKW